MTKEVYNILLEFSDSKADVFALPFCGIKNYNDNKKTWKDTTTFDDGSVTVFKNSVNNKSFYYNKKYNYDKNKTFFGIENIYFHERAEYEDNLVEVELSSSGLFENNTPPQKKKFLEILLFWYLFNKSSENKKLIKNNYNYYKVLENDIKKGIELISKFYLNDYNVALEEEMIFIKDTFTLNKKKTIEIETIFKLAKFLKKTLMFYGTDNKSTIKLIKLLSPELMILKDKKESRPSFIIKVSSRTEGLTLESFEFHEQTTCPFSSKDINMPFSFYASVRTVFKNEDVDDYVFYQKGFYNIFLKWIKIKNNNKIDVNLSPFLIFRIKEKDLAIRNLKNDVFFNFEEALQKNKNLNIKEKSILYEYWRLFSRKGDMILEEMNTNLFEINSDQFALFCIQEHRMLILEKMFDACYHFLKKANNTSNIIELLEGYDHNFELKKN